MLNGYNEESQEGQAVGEKTMTEKVETDRKPASDEASQQAQSKKPKEIGGPKGPEPTRYGDWEKGGRCIDF